MQTIQNTSQINYRGILTFLLLFFVTSTTGVLSLSAEEEGMSKSVKFSASLNEKGSSAAQNDEMAAAERLFKQALEVNPNNITAAYNLASVYLSEQKEEQAITILEKYTREYPKDAGLFARLGDAYFSSKNLKNAATAYENALRLDPQFPETAERLGNVYSLDNKIGKAIEMYLKAVENQPRNAELLGNLSNLFLADGQADKAVSTAKTALQVQASKETYLTLGSAYESMKDLKNAVIAYERARDLGDTSDELADRIRVLKKLSNQ